MVAQRRCFGLQQPSCPLPQECAAWCFGVPDNEAMLRMWYCRAHYATVKDVEISLFVFDIRHEFINTKGIIKLFTNSNKEDF